MFFRIRFDRNCIFAAVATLSAVLSLTLAPVVRAGNAAPDPAPTGSETVLYSFGLDPISSSCTKIDDGADPKGSLTYVTATGLLFGRTSTTTAKGNGDGTIFQINPDGTGYLVDHFFTGAKTDGNDPRHNAMTLVNTTLYGTTLTGGKNDNGTIFSINDDGTAYSSPLFDFAKSATGNKGDQPHSCFVAAGSVLYGMTSEGGKHGGSTGFGTIFSFDTSSSTYTRLYSFGGVHGSDPHGQLILDPNGSTFYGMTRTGGKSAVGVVFSFSLMCGSAGSSKCVTKYKVLHNFRCPGNSTPMCIDASDGATPDHGTLLLSGTTLYGLTTAGGKFGLGTIFSYDLNAKKFTVLRSFGPASTNDGLNPFGSLMLNGSVLYGTTRLGGNAGLGTVFQINTDGTGYARVHNFLGGNNDGANPIDDVILVPSTPNTLYGMTEAGGRCNNGVIFSIALP